MSLTFANGANSSVFTVNRRTISADDFGIHYNRWPYDPAMSGATFTSPYPARWQNELDGAIGWIRTFDPSIGGRYSGGGFLQDGTSTDPGSNAYGRISGGAWYGGMLRSDGSYDWTKLDLLIGAARGKGVKVLMNLGMGPYWDSTNSRYIEYPLPTGEYWSTGATAWLTRWVAFFDAFLKRAGDWVHAVELHNEPDYWADRDRYVGAGHATQFAILCRLAKQLIRQRNLSIKVLSPPFRESKEAYMRTFLSTSAQGLSLFGIDGAGTVGKEWIDVVAHHNYGAYDKRGDGGSTTAMDNAGVNDVAADAAFPGLVGFADMLTKAQSAVAAARYSGWTGPVWNTEFHISGSTVITAGSWYPRKLTYAGYRRALEQMLVCSVLAGYEKAFVYAADHAALGFFDNTGTPPEAGQYAKSPDGSSRGAAAMADVIRSITGAFSGGFSDDSNPFFVVGSGGAKVATSTNNGVFG